MSSYARAKPFCERSSFQALLLSILDNRHAMPVRLIIKRFTLYSSRQCLSAVCCIILYQDQVYYYRWHCVDDQETSRHNKHTTIIYVSMCGYGSRQRVGGKLIPVLGVVMIIIIIIFFGIIGVILWSTEKRVDPFII